MANQEILRMLSQNLAVSEEELISWVDAKDVDAKLVRLNYLVSALSAVMDSEGIKRWLQRPHPDFDGYAPIELLGSEWATKQLFKSLDRWLMGSPFS